MLFKSVLLNPFTTDHRLAAVAWLTVFYTTVASWVDWHVVMARRPYDTRQLIDRFRFYSDVGIAVLYAYLLFTIEPLIGKSGGTLFYHLIGYPLVFILYLSSGSRSGCSSSRREVLPFHLRAAEAQPRSDSVATVARAGRARENVDPCHCSGGMVLLWVQAASRLCATPDHAASSERLIPQTTHNRWEPGFGVCGDAAAPLCTLGTVADRPANRDSMIPTSCRS